MAPRRTFKAALEQVTLTSAQLNAAVLAYIKENVDGYADIDWANTKKEITFRLDDALEVLPTTVSVVTW